MRWRPTPPYERGDVRKRSGFLFVPRNIGGETRWLERAKWTEKFKYYGMDGDEYWEGIEWD